MVVCGCMHWLGSSGLFVKVAAIPCLPRRMSWVSRIVAFSIGLNLVTEFLYAIGGTACYTTREIIRIV